MALPLRDDLPTRRVSWVTMVLIGLNAFVFLVLQPPTFQSPFQPGISSARDRIDAVAEQETFTMRWSTVPCEVMAGQPLASAPDGCEKPPSRHISEDKPVYLSLLTAMFLHGSVVHLVGNLVFLWVFGNNVEDRLGRFWFLVVYLVGGLAGFLTFVLAHQHASSPLLGASGAVAAVMGAYLVLYPRARVLTAVATAAAQVVYLPAVAVLGLFFVTQFFTSGDQIAWEAHAGGMAAGALLALAIGLLPSVRRRARTDVDLGLRRAAPTAF
ncbi:MAG: rhomboid family intramembrane serine protease [Acidimicrobiales bacterium]|nr:rhomboid family intramembrane serine protease [Acidimicrobiales bacterium]